jgi:serine/threonine-protein phosphatase PP1 catalytic subunit
LAQLNNIKRPIEPYENKIILDLLWSDPSSIQNDWCDNLDRGIGFNFGKNTIDKFLEKYDFDLICRSHQVVEEGYEFFNNRKLVTLFSAPNYCG